MNAAGRLGLYGTALAAAFAVAFGAAALVVPRGAAQEAQHEEGNGMSGPGTQGSGTHGSGTHGSGTHGSGAHGSMDHSTMTAAQDPAGVSLSVGGYTLSPVTAPAAMGEQGVLSFRILNSSGAAVTAYEQQHEKDLHLIVVRSDGAQFRHVHPVLDAGSGTWSVPWTWDAAGSYRVFTDFAATGADPVTLTRTVEVAGSFDPIVPATTAETNIDGFDARITGDLVPGGASELTVAISRGGAPVTTLQPYLGAYGHLVALRVGDLAYLHVHPEDAALRQAQRPEEGSGPEVRFAAHVPTAGRYLLYFDFQVDGSVHTAAFVLDAKIPHDH